MCICLFVSMCVVVDGCRFAFKNPKMSRLTDEKQAIIMNTNNTALKREFVLCVNSLHFRIHYLLLAHQFRQQQLTWKLTIDLATGPQHARFSYAQYRSLAPVVRAVRAVSFIRFHQDVAARAPKSHVQRKIQSFVGSFLQTTVTDTTLFIQFYQGE